ncbi:uncharacterized protein LOC124631963 [Helicoverpa zea]|uniref:uncharacterized protein LOC124631963 n=1 Tax=Helicoverpa zea TaxID=7113 RepID=UPI001F584A54|nr:uncharacterized protein LOC124631963 [Helicoverpa zea]
MCITKVVLCSVLILASLSLCQASKSADALAITFDTTVAFYEMYMTCVNSEIPSMKFATDDLKSFVNYPSKTTVGFAPKFTSNRRFFANMVSHPEFRNTLARDEEELRAAMIRKMRYCDSVVMDQELLQPMYEREVDQSKI